MKRKEKKKGEGGWEVAAARRKANSEVWTYSSSRVRSEPQAITINCPDYFVMLAKC